MKQLMKDIKEGNVSEGFKGFFQRKHLPLLGYLILAGAVAFTFWLYDHDRQQRRKDIAASIAINCNRLNLISDQQAADIYDSWNNLPKNAKLLGIKLTPELRAQVLIDANKSLKNLRFYECSVPPNQPQRYSNYKSIVQGKKTPTVPNRGT